MAVFALVACNRDASPDDTDVSDPGGSLDGSGGTEPSDSGGDGAAAYNKTTVTFQTVDELTITADLYTIHDEAPWMIMFHQDDASRGEYARIAPLLSVLGYNCLAVDQRLGWEKNGVLNETYANAIAQWRYIDIFTNEGAFADAIPDVLIDMEAAVLYVKNQFNAETVTIMGSGYSAGLALVLASELPQHIGGTLSFSPAELEIGGKTLGEYAAGIESPVLIAVQSASATRAETEAVYDIIPAENKILVATNEHATDALAYNSFNTAADENPTWKQVIEFLLSF